MANSLFHFNALQAILNEIGLDPVQANLIATASQAVDDFYEEKLIVLDNGELFYPVVTAHRMLDTDNLDSRDASNIWMPFHFFPDHDGVCRPGSANIMQLIDFVKSYPYESENDKWLMHGILLHIYADTFTHQKFMGLHCKHNDISDLDDEDVWNIVEYQSLYANVSPSIGHGEALTYPDDMWRSWCFSDNQGATQKQDNPELFLSITDHVCHLMEDLGYNVNYLDNKKREMYLDLYSTKGSINDYQSVMEDKFDAISKSYVSSHLNAEEITSYKKWKGEVMRPVQSKENKYLLTVEREDFYQSNWVRFQYLAKELRGFFKQTIFPNIRISTVVY